MKHFVTLSNVSHLPKPKRFLLQRFRKAKLLAVTVALSQAFQLVYPNVAFALTSGPANPDFASFEPVATTNMVNEFTGQFVYNLPVIEIPGASGGGYALSLSYHSGDGPEAEASWVGNGWTLNPGCINRNKRGVPDDFKGKGITYYNDMPKNWTIAGSPSVGAELFSNSFDLTASFSVTASYNNYRGFQVSHSFGLSAFKGLVSLGINYSEGDVTFSPRINPAAILSYANELSKKNNSNAGNIASKQSTKMLFSGIGKSMANSAESMAGSILNDGTSRYISYLLSDVSSPYNVTKYEGNTYSGYVSLTADPPPVPVGISGSLNVSYTEQQNIPSQNIASYGYMYAGNASNNESEANSCIEDYTVENQTNFTHRDIFMPIPFSTPDAFFVSGEGVGGGFRMFNDRIGVFSPNYTESHTSLHYFGADIHVGLDDGAGGEGLLSGEHTLKVHSSWAKNDGVGGVDNGNTNDLWFVPYGYHDIDHNVSEDMSFRFNNDLGGSVSYHESDSSPVQIGVYPYQNNGAPYLLTDITKMFTGGKIPGYNRRNGRSSYIGYHTNAEIKKKVPSVDSTRAFAFEHNKKIQDLTARDASFNSTLDDELGEMSVVNESGERFTYGLPIYTAGEKSMQHRLTSSIDNRYLTTSSIGDRKVGEEYTAPYASSYLLTEITTPDYIDVNLNGPDTADLGGYTKFSYNRYIGHDNKNDTSGLYKWRIPYNGVYYKPLRLSDNIDDMGAYQSGYKEIYYLDTIDTKTHYAVFITEDRDDAYDAPGNDNVAAAANWKTGPERGAHRLQKLTKIMLYAKATHSGDPDRLIKTVNFEYNYESWPRTPNSAASTHGKLTLKKVWFEYNGVSSAFISPYIFEYTYPTAVAYPAQYQFIQNEMAPSGINETPDYTPYIDCWGNYQYDGEYRRNHFQWTSQTPGVSFDPAAWQLKRIILPSGGEIHMQYEQNSYSYVQDKPACVMMHLKGDPGDLAKYTTYRIDPGDIGITSTADINEMVASIKKSYPPITNPPPFLGEKMFFKFFYTLMNDDMESLGSCNGDFVEGYMNVKSAAYVGGQIVITAEGNPTPHEVCRDYIKHEIGGRLLEGNCSALTNDMQAAGDSTSINQLGNMLISKIKNDILGRHLDCKKLDTSNSYLRIPVKRKLGGGIRVKRLLMYNPGVDPHNPTLYGTEYVYENTANGRSYGVATNEPLENKEENMLVNSLQKRFQQSSSEKLLAGKDRERFEGPFGMMAYPSASIGYSRIIKKNIYESQKTGQGYTVVDYYTARDYPLASLVFPNWNLQDKQHFHIGIFSYEIDNGLRGAQSCTFIQNQMHGQLKAITDYAGVFDPKQFKDGGPGMAIAVSSKTYEYFEPGQIVPMYDFQHWVIYYDQPGKEMDITVDRRCVEDQVEETRLTGDFTIGVFVLVEVPYPIAFPISSYSKMRLNTLSINKVVHYPAIVKKITTMKDGYTQSTENVAFDPLTVRPVLTRTYDGYDSLNLPGDPKHDGAYTTYDVPASSQYEAMGQKAWNERYTYWCSNPTFTHIGTSPYYNIAGVNQNKIFTKGDLIALHVVTTPVPDAIIMANIMDTAGNDIRIGMAKSYYPSLPTNLIPGSPNIFKIEVVRSGYTNQLNSSMKGFTEYGNKVNNISAFAMLCNFLTPKINHVLHSINPTDSLKDIDITPYGDVLGLSHDPSGTVNNCPADGYVKKVNVYKNVTAGKLKIVFNPSPTSSFDSAYYIINLVGNSPSYGPTVISLFSSNVGMFGVNPEILSCWDGHKIDTLEFPGALTAIRICSNGKIPRKNIIRAEVTTYSDSWNYDILPFGFDTSKLNPYEKGIKGKWRPYQTYVYRDTVVKGSHVAAGQRTYKMAGTTPFSMGQWKNIMAVIPENWIKTNQVETYTYNGNSVQEFDAEGVFSSAKYGYQGILPYLVAQNAKRASVLFESFENNYGTFVEDHMAVDKARLIKTAHTGFYGYRMDTTDGNNMLVLPPLKTDATNSEGMMVKLWAKLQGTPPPPVLSIAYSAATSGTIPLNYVARSGEWALFEARWYNAGWTGNVTFTIQNSTGEDRKYVVLDDVRVQPLESKMTAYVYDTKNYKLSAVMDDQHFATFYQYNGEGKLVRKAVETVKGNKTVEESQYHLPQFMRQ